MAFSLCAMFLKAVRLQSLKVSAVLLVVFFFYDIFMVFISPVIFKKSVMVEVATAGAAGEDHAVVSDDGRSCSRTQGERMPVLFMVPRFDFYGGYAMLGLGDVVMPGLLVCLMLRYDYATRGPDVCSWAHGGRRRSSSYFVLTVVGYAVGLMLALMANYLGITINGVRGQPALLYLVPCTLGLVVVVAACRGDLGDMWRAEDLTALGGGLRYGDEGALESQEEVWRQGTGAHHEALVDGGPTQQSESFVDASDQPPASGPRAGAAPGRPLLTEDP